MPELREKSGIRRASWVYIGLFSVIAIAYAYVQWSPTFKDPDSFYHLKLAEMLGSGVLVRDFSWLPFTTLADNFADHHLLYHLLLVPFIAVFGSFVGAKVATVVFALLALAAAQALMTRAKIRHAWAYTLLLATCSSFIFRINLTKASALALALFLLAFMCTLARKDLALLAVGAVHVWTHGSWPAAFAIVGAVVFARALVESGTPGDTRTVVRRFMRAIDARPFAALFAGLLIGLIVNPYFPGNLAFYYEQIVQIAVIGHGRTIAVGAEWYPYPANLLYIEASIVFLLFAGAIVLLGIAALQDDVITDPAPLERERAVFIVSSFILAVLFMALSLRSRRHIEYFVPFAVLFDAALLDTIMRRISAGRLLDAVAASFGNRVLAKAVIPVAFALIAFLSVRGVLGVAVSFRDGIPWTEYRDSGAWLAAHTDPGEVIVHGGWDSFPMLWYWNDSNRYIAGLDATFFYRQDPAAYERWAAMIEGETDIEKTMRETFGARFLLVEKRKELRALRDAAAADTDLFVVHEDEDAVIYSSL